MQSEFWLVATKSGIKALTKRLPVLQPHEVGIALNIEIPDDMFRPRIVTAPKIVISTDQIVRPSPVETKGRKLDLQIDND